MNTTRPEWVLKLAAQLLREYSERLSNDGCNDMDLPSYVPEAELAEAISKSEQLPIADAKACTGLNHFVADAMANLLWSDAGEGKGE